MKKLISIFVLSLFVISLSGCSSEDANRRSDQDNNNKKNTTENIANIEKEKYVIDNDFFYINDKNDLAKDISVEIVSKSKFSSIYNEEYLNSELLCEVKEDSLNSVKEYYKKIFSNYSADEEIIRFNFFYNKTKSKELGGSFSVNIFKNNIKYIDEKDFAKDFANKCGIGENFFMISNNYLLVGVDYSGYDNGEEVQTHQIAEFIKANLKLK